MCVEEIVSKGGCSSCAPVCYFQLGMVTAEDFLYDIKRVINDPNGLLL